MTLEQLRKPFSRRPCLSGSLFWIAFALVAVIVRGVRWDENYEFAQVILGQIPYPEGHPLFQYVRGFYSLQTYSLAGLMYFFPEPLLANLLRNWAFLVSSTVPVFLLGTLFSRKQLVGHVAVVFVLLEIHTSFYSTYPVLVWPMIFSNGPIGLGYMLVALWALLDRRYRIAGLLIGFAPAVHLGQFPPLLLVAALQVLWLLRRGQIGPVRTLLLYAIPGLVICVLFAAFIQWFAVEAPVEGPYYSAAAPELLWRTFMERYAGHRAIPWTTGHIVLVGAVILSVALIAMRRAGVVFDRTAHPSPPLESPWTWALIYCALAAGMVWGIMAVHYAMGPDVPYLLVGWLPYRLMNHVAPVLIPLLVAIGYARERRMPAYISAALLAALLVPLADLVPESEWVKRYLSSGEYLFFFLFGGAAGTGIVLAGRRYAVVTLAGGAALLLLLGWFHQYGAACTLAGLVAACVPVPAAITPRALRFAVTGLAFLTLLTMLAREGERHQRQHLNRSEFHVTVARYLAAEGKPDAMILVQSDQAGDQMLFGHPVMADMATMLHGVYRPTIAPSVNAIFQDFYGVYLDPNAVRPDPPLAWYDVWPNRPLAEWQRLSAKYDVEFVSAPAFMQLPLERVVRGSQHHLYRIPPASAIETPGGPLVR
jgi:hypothetical protein